MTLAGSMGIMDMTPQGIAARKIHEQDTVMANIVNWLRRAGYPDAANALAALHVDDCSLRGVQPLCYVVKEDV